jgi:signal transduction histidine kinase
LRIESAAAQGVRSALAFIALCAFLINFDASATPLPRPALLCFLAMYTAWNLTLLAMPKLLVGESANGWRYRLGVAVYALLLAAANQQEWILLPALLLSILVLSSGCGAGDGLRASVLAACALAASHLLFRYHGLASAAGWIPLAGLTVLTVGSALSFVGGGLLKGIRRQSLVHCAGRFANPRFGVDETVWLLAERLRAFFDADICVVVYTTAGDPHHLLHRADRRGPGQTPRAVTLVEPVARRLLNFPPDLPVVYAAQGAGGRVAGLLRRLGLAAPPGSGVDVVGEEVEEVVEMFDAGAFMSCPLNFCFSEMGRVYLINREGGRAFDRAELGLLLEAVAAAKPVIENLNLVNRLATEAAEQERKRIARDLHDTTIQPFIGLMMGLSAVREKIGTDPAGAADDLTQLLDAAKAELSEVRGYVRGLKDRQGADGYEFLSAVRRFCEKFQESSGIVVEFEVEGDVRPNDRLAAETFQLIAEGLSNIRRHARATRAWLNIACRDGVLHLLLCNDVPKGQETASFKPKSLCERTAALGGQLRVGRDWGDLTGIQIDIPM